MKKMKTGLAALALAMSMYIPAISAVQAQKARICRHPIHRPSKDRTVSKPPFMLRMSRKITP